MATTPAIEIVRLRSSDAGRMHAVVTMLPPPEWRDEAVPPPAYFERTLADTSIYVMAAFAGDGPAGFASAYRFPALTGAYEQAYVYDVYVAPAYRAVGVGRRLVDALLAALRADGVAEAWVGTDGPNLAAQRLYEAAGATEVGRDYVEYEFDLTPPPVANTPTPGGL